MGGTKRGLREQDDDTVSSRPKKGKRRNDAMAGQAGEETGLRRSGRNQRHVEGKYRVKTLLAVHLKGTGMLWFLCGVGVALESFHR